MLYKHAVTTKKRKNQTKNTKHQSEQIYETGRRRQKQIQNDEGMGWASKESVLKYLLIQKQNVKEIKKLAYIHIV